MSLKIQLTLAEVSLLKNRNASSDFILATNNQDVLEAYQRMVNPVPEEGKKLIYRNRIFLRHTT